MPTVLGAATPTWAGCRSGTSAPATSDGRPVGPLEIDAETAPLVQQAAAVFLETRSMMAVQRFFDEHGYERAGVALRRWAGLAAAGRHPDRRRREDPRYLAGHLGRGDARGDRGRAEQARTRSWATGGVAVVAVGVHGVRPVRAADAGRRSPQGESDRWHRPVPALLPLRPGAGPHDRVRGDDRPPMPSRRGSRSGCWLPCRGRGGSNCGPVGPVERVVDTAAVEADLAALARRYGAGDLLEVEWNAARQVLLERIAVADANVPAHVVDLPDVKDLHAAWTRGKLTLPDKRLVIAAVVEQITVNAGVRGRAIVGNRPEDRVVITWRAGSTGPHAAPTRRPSRQ